MWLFTSGHLENEQALFIYNGWLSEWLKSPHPIPSSSPTNLLQMQSLLTDLCKSEYLGMESSDLCFN